MPMRICAVAADVSTYSIDKLYDYMLPPELADLAQIGSRVLVPFGRANKKIEAVILAFRTSHDPNVPLKCVEMLLDDERMAMESPLFVLTNEAKLFGAVYMFLPEVMDKIADEKGDDLYILPSSIHEILILKTSELDDLPRLQHMVQDINEMQVPMEQRLSNHVYRYSKRDGLVIAE